MDQPTSFSDVLEAAESLTIEERETLVDILHRRMIEQRRAEVVKEVEDARREFQAGECKPATPEQLIREITS